MNCGHWNLSLISTRPKRYITKAEEGNSKILKCILDRFKTQEMHKTATILRCYKSPDQHETQEIHEKSVDDYSDWHKNQEMCKNVIDAYPFALDNCP